jgi:coatomer subunit delta
VQVPVSVNCWPTDAGAETYINIEYESTASYDLQNVVITIPGASSCLPTLRLPRFQISNGRPFSFRVR